MNEQRYLLVVSGPSGCGKTTVVKELLAEYPDVQVAVSATTRPRREGEEDGIAYHFWPEERFVGQLGEDAFLEHTVYMGHHYGTLRSEVDARLAQGISCVLEIEVEGAQNVKAEYPECTTVFLEAPSREVLEQRLRGRGSEDEEVVQRRLRRAEEELLLAAGYDYRLINHDSRETAREIYRILQERQKA